MDELLKAIQSSADPNKAKILMRFFKTGVGEYGEGDRFYGIVVPVQRIIAKRFWKTTTLNDVIQLLKNPYHECRMIALLMLIERSKKANEAEKKEIVGLYLGHTKYINNWDLVDLSAPHIVGEYLANKDATLLYELAQSDSLWEKRIAMISCFRFIKNGDYKDAFGIALALMNDRHDLIHKAVGWMLREIGKRDQSLEEEFLKKHYRTMPRTMLRYAIERFDEVTRKTYLDK